MQSRCQTSPPPTAEVVGGFGLPVGLSCRPEGPFGTARLPNWQPRAPFNRPSLSSVMVGWAPLKLEPRLDGARVVGASAHLQGWIGRRFPWAAVRMRGALVTIVDEDGRPIETGGGRTAWARDGLRQIAERASDRAFRRELSAGGLNRVYVTDSPVSARVLVGILTGLAAFCVVGVTLPIFGASLMFNLGPTPTPLDRLLAATPWLLLLVMVGVCLFILSPVALARSGSLRVTPRGLELTEPSGAVSHWPRQGIAGLRRSFAIEILGRDGLRTRLTHAPGLAAALAALEREWLPQAAAREHAALRRTLIRALVLWVLGCIVAGVAMVWTGAGPHNLAPIPILNAILVTAINATALPALGWIAVEGKRRLEPWLARKLLRASRSAVRR